MCLSEICATNNSLCFNFFSNLATVYSSDIDSTATLCENINKNAKVKEKLRNLKFGVNNKEHFLSLKNNRERKPIILHSALPIFSVRLQAFISLKKEHLKEEDQLISKNYHKQ